MKSPCLPFWKVSLLSVTAALSFTLSAHAEEAGAFFFRDGDRAMILGDSITQQRMYSTMVESYVLSRFPNWNITFRNTGWGGDTMGLRTRGGVDAGFDRDIKPLNPTAVTIDFGMNDAREGDKGYAPYLANALKLTDKFAAMGTRVALISPSAEERYTEGQPAGSAYNLRLQKYSEGLRDFAKEKGILFVDQLTPMIGVIESGRKAGVLPAKESGPRLIPDGVHPNWDGHLVMATEVLKGLHAPALVSKVEINGKTREVKAEKAKVTDVTTGEKIAFTRLDDAMPWPVPPETQLALKIPGFTPFDDLSRYDLVVSDLPAEQYKVSVDGKDFGTYTREQLAAGVNFTSEAIKQFGEVRQLLAAIVAKNDLFFNRWRQVQLAEIPAWIPAEAVEPARAAKLKELDAKLAEAEAKVNSLRAPKSHQWVLSPVTK